MKKKRLYWQEGRFADLSIEEVVGGFAACAYCFWGGQARCLGRGEQSFAHWLFADGERHWQDHAFRVKRNHCQWGAVGGMDKIVGAGRGGQ